MATLDGISRKVLLVEDDPAQAKVIEALVRAMGWELAWVQEGGTAMERVAEFKPDVCVVDLVLPQRNGFSITQQIKSKPNSANTPVILITGARKDTPQWREALARSKADAVLDKPLSMAELRARLTELVTLAEGGSPSKTVLVVDDDVSLNAIASRLIKTQGYNVVQAYTGTEALELFVQHKPALCLVDMLLPEMHGRDVARQIKQELGGAGVPVLLMSSLIRSDAERREDLRASGAEGFLSKPFDTAKLIAEVNTRLRGGEHPITPKPSKPTSRTSPRINPTGRASGSLGASHRRDRRKLRMARRAPATQDVGKMSTQGRLEDVEFADLLAVLFRNRLTGRLDIRADGVQREYFFEDGSPHHARSNVAREALGALLVEDGMLDSDQIQDILAEFPDTPLGQALIQKKLIDEEQLQTALKRQVRQRFLAGFGHHRGLYAFHVGERASRSSGTLHPVELIQEGVERFARLDNLAPVLQAQVHSYVAPSPMFNARSPHFAWSDSMRTMGEMLDGTHTLGDLLRARPEDVAPTLLWVWSLLKTGLVVFRPQPARTPPRIATDDSGALLCLDAKDDASQRIEASILQREIDQVFARIDSDDMRAFLSLSDDASLEQCVSVAQGLMERFAPEKIAFLSDTWRDRARRVYAKSRTIEQLCKQAQRKQALPHTPDTPQRRDSLEMRLSKGALAHAQARAMMNAGDWEGAVKALRAVVLERPDDPELIADLNWAQNHLPASHPEHTRDIQDRLQRILVSHPSCARALFYLAKLGESSGRPSEAMSHLRRVLTLDPTHNEAQSMLRRLESPEAQKPREEASLWMQLFGGG